MNQREKRAFTNIKYAANWLLGGLENTLLDYPEDSDEYKHAQAMLSNHNRLVATLYDWATTDVYGDGWAGGTNSDMLVRDIRFCGKEWLMECCEERIKKEGY